MAHCETIINNHMWIFIACQTIISDRKLVFIRTDQHNQIKHFAVSCHKMKWKTIRLTVGQTKEILNNKIIIIYWIGSRAESGWSEHENLICLCRLLHNRIQGALPVIGNLLSKQKRKKVRKKNVFHFMSRQFDAEDKFFGSE